MIVPCDTDVILNITLKFGGIDFKIPPTLAIDAGPGHLCLGTFASLNTPSRKQSLLYCSTQHSHVEQQSCTLVLPSCELFTLSSTKEIRELDLPRTYRAGRSGGCGEYPRADACPSDFGNRSWWPGARLGVCTTSGRVS